MAASKVLRKRWADTPREKRKAITKPAVDARAKLAPEQRSESAKKGAKTRLANFTPAKLKAIGKKIGKKLKARAASKPVIERRAQTENARQWHADVRAAAERLKAYENGAVVATPKKAARSSAWSVSDGARLQASRDEAGLSRSEVALAISRLGIKLTDSAIKKHESGTNAPRTKVKQAYSTVLKKPLVQLFPAS